MTTQRKATILASKIRASLAPNGINVTITDTNPSRRCSAECLNVGRSGWNVRIDKNGIAGWKYAANIPTATAEAAYEYCLEFGTRVES